MRKRRRYTLAEKQRVIAEYTAAPAGEKSLVAERHHISESNMYRWARAAAEPAASYAPAVRARTGPRPAPARRTERRDAVRLVESLKRAGVRGAVARAAARLGLPASTVYYWSKGGEPAVKAISKRVERANKALVRVNEATPVVVETPSASGPGQLIRECLRRLRNEANIDITRLLVRKGRCEVTYRVTEAFAV